MALEFQVDADKQIITVRVSGVVGDHEGEEYMKTLLDDPLYDPAFSVLADAREVARVDLTSPGMQSLAEYMQLNDARHGGGKLAIVVKSDELFGLARMYQQLRFDAQYEIAVFRDYYVALAWLLEKDSKADHTDQLLAPLRSSGADRLLEPR
jgi:hypothetical protein